MAEVSKPIRAEYLFHIEKQKSSGLSISKYCEQNNLIEHKFSYYRNFKPRVKNLDTSNFKFSQVRIKESESLKNPLDPIWLAQFVKALTE